MHLNDIYIVLARPSEWGNTGAVCRAMKNMGLSRLRIAAPAYMDTSKGISMEASVEKLLARAIHAAHIWNEAEHFATLQEALTDCTISIGTSRRRGRRRKSVTVTPRELAAFLQSMDGKAALVFGNERTGLNGEELDLCNIASHIPVHPEFPSINLSHAVQIYAYELHQCMAEGPAPVPGTWIPMNAGEIQALVNKTCNFLESIGFYKYPGRAKQESFLQDLIARAGLNIKEGRYLSSIIAKGASMHG